VIDIDKQESITHRPDLWGHLGMAREVAAIKPEKTSGDPVNLSLLPESGSPVKVEIEDLTLCPRYSALVFEKRHRPAIAALATKRLTSVGSTPSIISSI